MADTLPVLVSSSFSVLLESLSEQVIVCLALLEVLRPFFFFFFSLGPEQEHQQILQNCFPPSAPVVGQIHCQSIRRSLKDLRLIQHLG